MRAVIVSGSCGIPASASCLEELVTLQMVKRLEKMGLTIPGSSFFLCRIRCGRDVRDKILSREKTDAHLLILSDEEEDAPKETQRTGKRRRGKTYAITAAACRRNIVSR